MGIIKKIHEIWDQDFREEFEDRERRTKTLTNGEYEFRVLLDVGRKEFYEKMEKPTGCPFDDKSQLNRFVQEKSLCYIVNIYPYFDRQFMAFPLDHRGFPTRQDIDELIELQKQSDYVIMMNMRDAGASIEDHIHYQCIQEKLPLDSMEGQTILKGKE